MTSKSQFKPIKKQQLLRSVRGPEAQRQKVFKIARLLEVHERQQTQPFLNTALGKLPPEIRVIIYQYLVVGQGHEPSATMSLPLAAAPSIASQRFFHWKKSGGSILQICRQIYLEARPIFDASGIPYFADARELSGFLVGIGPTGRLQLEACRIGSLVSQESVEVEHSRPRHMDPRMFYLNNNGCILWRHKKIDPDVTNAFSLLIECRNLRTIYMDMKQGEENMYVAILRTSIAGACTELRCWNPGHWFVQRSIQQSWYDGVPFFGLASWICGAFVSSGRPMKRDALVMVDMKLPPSPDPFPKTRLGRLPQKLRIQIYHELVAIPPIHASQRPNTRGTRAGEQKADRPLTPPTTFVHLHASYLKVLRICRQMYIEAHPIFYSRGSFYTQNTKELRHFSRLSLSSFSQSSFRRTTTLSFTVTSLCVRNLLSWSDEKAHYLNNMLFESVYHLRKWNNLQKLCLCMRTGEELGYLECLFLLPRSYYGVVDFVDDSHWVLRRQCPQEEWQIQYACFETNVLGYRRGKGNVELSLEDIEVQRRILRVDSAAKGLKKGDERYVEVDIGGTSRSRMPSGMEELVEKFERLSLDR